MRKTLQFSFWACKSFLFSFVGMHQTDIKCFNKAFSEIENFLLGYFSNDLASHTFYSNMARGVDEIFALIVIKHNVPLVFVLPNSLKWHKTEKSQMAI